MSYLPAVQSMSAREADNPLSKHVMFVFIALFTVSLKIKAIRKFAAIKIYILITFWFCLQLGIISAIGGYEINVFNEIRPLLIVCVALIIGWQINLSFKALKNTGILFIVSVLFMLLMQIFINVGGFQIQEQYLTDVKNSVGCLAATAMIMAVIFALKKDNTKKSNALFFILATVLLVCLLTIRARTASLIALILFLFLIVRKLYSKKHSMSVTAINVLIIGIIIYLLLPEIAVNYVFDSFLYGREKDVLSHRGERNVMALNFIKENLLFGNMSGKAHLPWIHNFPLLQLYNFGLIGALPILTLYIYLFVVLVKGLFKYNIFDIRNAGFLLLAVSFGISMAEPTFPFGPGTVNVFNFIMFGATLKYNYELKTSKSLKL
jgi:hypothetical protein